MHDSWIENKKICPPVLLDWEWIPLKDVTQVQGGFAFHSSDFTTFGIPVVRMSDLKQGMLDLSEAVKVSDQTVCQLSQFMLKKGDMIIGMSGSITNYAIVDEQNLPAYLNQRVGRLILKNENRANYNYLTHVLRSPFYESWAYKEATGVAQLNISSQQIEAMYFLLPPLSEQRRIAEILDTIDEAIQKTELLISKLKAMKQGLLHDLMTRGLDKIGKLRDPKAHPEQFKDSPLGRIPRIWATPTLDAITTAPICYGIVQVGPYTNTGVPVLAIRDLHSNYVSNVHKTAPGIDKQYTRSRVASGDLLLSIKGTIGKIGVVPPFFVGNISRDLARIRVIRDVLPDYLRYMFESPFGQNRLSLTVVGTTRAELSIGILKELCVLIPPLDEQKQITVILDSHSTRVCTEERYRDKLKLQKKGLMHDLLTGKIRVKM